MNDYPHSTPSPCRNAAPGDGPAQAFKALFGATRHLGRRLWLAAAAALLFAAASLPIQAGESGDKVALARKIMNEHQEWDTAAGLLNEFLKDRPDDPAAPEALVLLGYACEKQNQFDAARDAYARALDRKPPPSQAVRQDALQGAAYACYQIGKFTEAAQYYGRFAAAFPEHAKSAEARLWQAEALYQAALAARKANPEDPADPGAARRFRAAEDAFAGYLERYPDAKQSASALASAGYAAFDGKAFARAAAHFRQFVAKYPSDTRAPECQFYAAEALYRLDDFANARQEYARLLAPPLNRDTARAAEARAGMAWCDYYLKQPLDAAAGFAEAAGMTADPELSRSRRYDAALAYREGGDPAGATREFQTLLKDAPDSAVAAKALCRLGSMALEAARKAPQEQRAARLRDAAALLLRAVEHPALAPEGDAPDAWMALAEARLDLADYEASAKAFGEFTTRWPNDARVPWALYHLALARREQSLAAARTNDFPAEKAYLEQAKEALRGVFARDNEKLRLQAAYALADYLNALDDVAASRKVYRWVAQEGPKWAENWRGTDGKPDPALPEAAHRLALDSWFRLGESLYAGKENAEAATCYQRVLADYPDSEHAGMALLRLGEIAEAAGDRAAALDRYDEAVKQGKSAVASGYARLRLGALLLARAQGMPAAGADAAQTAQRTAFLTRALGALDQVIAAMPPGVDPARPYYYRAETRYALGMKPEALADYRQAQSLDKNNALGDALLFGLAWAWRDAGDSARALAEFTRLKDEYPKSGHRPEALLMIGLLKRDAGDAGGALPAFAAIVAEYPQLPVAARGKLEEGMTLALLNRDAEAAATFEAFLQQYPDHPETPKALYRLAWSRGVLAKAEADRAARLDKELAALVSSSAPEGQMQPLKAERSDAQSKARVLEDRSAEPLRKLLDQYPGHVLADAAALRLGEIAYDRGDYAEALNLYRQAAELADRNNSDIRDKARYRLAWCQLRLADAARLAADTGAGKDPALAAKATREAEERTRAAQTAFEEIVKLTPDSPLMPEALFRSAEARRRLARTPEDFTSAVRLYDESVKRERERRAVGTPPAAFVAGAEYGAGLCLLSLGNPLAARERFDRCLADNATDPLAAGAWWGRGQASLDLGAFADARDAFEKAGPLDPEGETAAKAKYGLGWVAMKEKAWEKARIEFIATESYYRHWPEWASRALLQSARAAVELNEPDKAKKNLERLLERYPNQPAAAEAKELMAKLP